MKNKYLAILLTVLLSLSLVACGSDDGKDEYKTDAREVTWSELYDGEVSGNEKVTFSGIVGEGSTDETLIVSDDEGVYYVKNDADLDIETNDEITIWGVYVGDQSDTGLPMIDSKVIEVK